MANIDMYGEGKRSVPQKSLLTQLKEFWREFRRYKKGLVGLGILIGILLLASVGPLFTEEAELGGSSPHPTFAAPQWTSVFDPDSFPPRQLIDEPFSSEEWRDTWDLKTLSTNDSFVEEHISYDIGISQEQGGLGLRISDNMKKITSDSPEITFTLNRTITWSEAKPPNELDFTFQTQFSYEAPLTPKLISGAGEPYKIVFNTYLKRSGMTVEETFDYVEDKLGIAPPYSQMGKFGYLLTSFTSPTITRWTLKQSTLQKHIVRTIFERDAKESAKLDVIFAVTYQIRKTSLEERSPGSVSFHIKDLTMVGESYYYGVMGTTDTGADLFALIVRGARVSLLIGTIIALINVLLGSTVGLVSGYYGGKVDQSLMRVVDFILVLPFLPLALVLMNVFSRLNISPFFSIIFVLTITSWGGVARLIRSQTLSEKGRPYIEAARACGAPNTVIMFKHILPNIFPLIWMQLMLGVQVAILGEAALSFLGVGPDWTSWGRILYRVAGSLLQEGGGAGGGPTGSLVWWFIFFPGLMLALLGTGFVFVGMSLERITGAKGYKGTGV